MPGSGACGGEFSRSLIEFPVTSQTSQRLTLLQFRLAPNVRNENSSVTVWMNKCLGSDGRVESMVS